MPKIFISYRRADTQKDAGRIFDHLVTAFGRKNVFKDVDAIPVGSDFRTVITEEIEKCDVMLVLIGQKWLVQDEFGHRRIDAYEDYVRIEIEQGLQLPHVQVMPVLIDDTVMPSPDMLPYTIQAFAYLNAAKIRSDPDFHRDMQRLITTVKSVSSYTEPRFRLSPWFVIFSIMIILFSGVLASYLSTRKPQNTPENTVPTESSIRAAIGIEMPTPDTAATQQAVDIASTLLAQMTQAVLDVTASVVVPTQTPVPTQNPAIELAFAGVQSNAQWASYSPFTRNFNGVSMVLVPSGCFMMGSSTGEVIEQPMHRVCFTEPFWIDRYEVTNEQFQATGGQAARQSTVNVGSLPRTDINWFEAVAYCQARGGRLPSEAEWEYAARGVDSLNFPWGNTFMLEAALVPEYTGQPSSVGSRPMGQSWVGSLDMAGNVWEWTNTIFDGFAYPYVVDSREAYSDSPSVRHLIRGGSFNEPEEFQRSAKRTSNAAAYTSFNVGFRCARDY